MALAGRYEQNLVKLIKTLRTQFKAPNAKFVTASLGQTVKGSTDGGGLILDAMLNVDGTSGKCVFLCACVRALRASHCCACACACACASVRPLVVCGRCVREQHAAAVTNCLLESVCLCSLFVFFVCLFAQVPRIQRQRRRRVHAPAVDGQQLRLPLRWQRGDVHEHRAGHGCGYGQAARGRRVERHTHARTPSAPEPAQICDRMRLAFFVAVVVPMAPVAAVVVGVAVLAGAIAGVGSTHALSASAEGRCKVTTTSS